jgi:hypothetical protein
VGMMSVDRAVHQNFGLGSKLASGGVSGGFRRAAHALPMLPMLPNIPRNGLRRSSLHGPVRRSFWIFARTRKGVKGSTETGQDPIWFERSSESRTSVQGIPRFL